MVVTRTAPVRPSGSLDSRCSAASYVADAKSSLNRLCRVLAAIDRQVLARRALPEN